MINLSKDQKLAWYHAALILTKKVPVGSVTANNKLRDMLLNIGSFEDIYNQHFGMFPIEEKVENQLNSAYSKIDFDFKVITINDPEYPEKLRSVEGATPVLYCRGDLSLLNADKTISFVGTRELHNPEHVRHGEAVIGRLLDAGYQAIVSGLAAGSDTLGHQAALKYSGRTIAVLGTPLDQYFPKENRELQDEIAKNHLLISEYPIGIRSFGSFFANRNRTTVGLSSEGVVVARAGDRSGTQYAIRHCVEQGKQLYALENNIFEPEYQWVKKYKDSMKVIRQ
ncbi:MULTISPECIES: DNA-processing protein DprA [Vibrio]|uniref:DNA-processing protein DprA n=1 Tax=Vibrio bivalvicida TaxID=1276888 RepID=A0ABV4MK47_9VIBR|nr:MULTISPECIES: DNA-processing protein DprA [Vibrio]EIE1198455.1 DNA-protecting protein DprA [Vibrio parahaemolyticus]EJC6989283.1 DNA-protecting protein DprA [Vibrio parahaemolyticus]EJC6993987.1 DNA-protecting protein DprA [Vibrio parahaemolyticus]EJG1902438.1 DNA-protecting protein DprA [Vibrio parahaemolyticus]EKN4616235.1 DNA-protecting protein DprA [Vibrio parahaemolyticus]